MDKNFVHDLHNLEKNVKAVESYIKNLDRTEMPIFLDQISTVEESISKGYVLMIYEAVVRIHGPDIMKTLAKTLLSNSKDQHECSNIILHSIAKYVSASREYEKSSKIGSMLWPVVELLLDKKASPGVTLFLKAFVDCDNWSLASDDTIDCIVSGLASALSWGCHTNYDPPPNHLMDLVTYLANRNSDCLKLHGGWLIRSGCKILSGSKSDYKVQLAAIQMIRVLMERLDEWSFVSKELRLVTKEMDKFVSDEEALWSVKNASLETLEVVRRLKREEDTIFEQELCSTKYTHNNKDVSHKILVNMGKVLDHHLHREKGLKTYIKRLDIKEIRHLLGQPPQTLDGLLKGRSRTMLIYQVIARVHGPDVVDSYSHMIMSIIAQTLSSAADKDKYFSLSLEDSCSKVVVAIAKYGIKPTIHDDVKKSHIIDSLCQPLLNLLLDTQVSYGAALCFKILVGCDNWRFASKETTNELIQKLALFLACKDSNAARSDHSYPLIMDLVMTVAQHNNTSCFLEARARGLIQTGLDILNSSDATANVQFFAIEMIHTLIKCCEISSDLLDLVIKEMNKCEYRVLKPLVKSAALVTLLAVKELTTKNVPDQVDAEIDSKLGSTDAKSLGGNTSDTRNEQLSQLLDNTCTIATTPNNCKKWASNVLSKFYSCLMLAVYQTVSLIFAFCIKKEFHSCPEERQSVETMEKLQAKRQSTQFRTRRKNTLQPHTRSHSCG